MFRNIKRFLVNGISNFRQFVDNKIRAFVNWCQTTYIEVKDAINIACQKIRNFYLKTTDSVKHLLRQENRNALISSLGASIVGVFVAFFISNKDFIPFLDEWFVECFSLATLYGIAFSWMYRIIKYVLCLLYLYIKQKQTRNLPDNDPNKIKLTYKLLGDNIGQVCYIFCETHNNIVTP